MSLATCFASGLPRTDYYTRLSCPTSPTCPTLKPPWGCTTRVKTPSAFPLLTDSYKKSSAAYENTEVVTIRQHEFSAIHNGRMNQSYLDGHAEIQTPQELKPLLAEVGISLLSYYLDGNEISIP